MSFINLLLLTLGEHINADAAKARRRQVVRQFGCGTRVLRVVHGPDARATSMQILLHAQAMNKMLA
jgi:hypothetical protein